MGIQKPNMQALWADQGAIIAPTDSKVRLGWTAEVPPNQWENWVQNRQDRALAYLMQKGIPEWDSATEYIANKSFVQKDGKIYKCIATNTGNDPATSTTFWDGGLGLGLGTAAYSSLTTSSTDTTAGRVLKVGDYGLGTQSTLPDGSGFSTLPVGGNYQISGSHPDAPSAGGGSLHVGGTSSLKTYLYVQNNTRKVYVKSGTSQWTELWSGLNFNPSDKADKTTTVSAGTGLSGGGDLSQSRTLSVVYGVAQNTSAQGNDSRIVNALQRGSNLSDLNNASTARTNLGLGGSATLNVGTAANTVAAGNDSRITGAAQKSSNLSDLTNITTARNNLGLGNSAVRNVVSNISDTGGGNKVVTQGWMGLGSQSEGISIPSSGSNLNDYLRTGFYSQRTTSGARNGSNYPVNLAGCLFVYPTGGNDGVGQTYYTFQGDVYFRTGEHLDSPSSAVWKEWKKVAVTPIGMCYTQFPGTPSPSDLYGGTWVLLFNTEGVFFRTEGNAASNFGGGIQADEFRSHTHTVSGVASESGGFGGGQSGWWRGVVTTSSAGGNETRPRNRTIRVWQKTSN